MMRIVRVDDYGGTRLGYVEGHNCSDNDCKK
jgi:hypothetical protein